MNKKSLATLNSIFRRPVSGSIRWKDIEMLFYAWALKFLNEKAAVSQSFCLAKFEYFTDLTQALIRTKVLLPVYANGWKHMGYSHEHNDT